MTDLCTSCLTRHFRPGRGAAGPGKSPVRPPVSPGSVPPCCSHFHLRRGSHQKVNQGNVVKVEWWKMQWAGPQPLSGADTANPCPTTASNSNSLYSPQRPATSCPSLSTCCTCRPGAARLPVLDRGTCCDDAPSSAFSGQAHRNGCCDEAPSSAFSGQAHRNVCLQPGRLTATSAVTKLLRRPSPGRLTATSAFSQASAHRPVQEQKVHPSPGAGV